MFGPGAACPNAQVQEIYEDQDRQIPGPDGALHGPQVVRSQLYKGPGLQRQGQGISEGDKKVGYLLPAGHNQNKEAAGYPQIAYSLSRDILAADLYNMAAGRDMYRFSEYVRKPFCMD